MQKIRIAVIGAGAAGMMAACAAAAQGAEVTVFERNEKPGKKLFITGKGRCNLTNASDVDTILKNIVTNRKFLYSALYTFTNEDVMRFFEDRGLLLKTERGNRVFPDSDKSSDVIAVLVKTMKQAEVTVRYHSFVDELIVDTSGEMKCVTGICLKDKKKMLFDRVIMATGGLSYPVTGSDGEGLNILKKYGHTITQTTPSLVPMNVKEEFVKNLQGLSLKNIEVRFYETGRKKELYREFGEMLFTHFGVSGPVILSASSVIGKKLRDGNLILEIDLKPALSMEQLDDRVLRDFKERLNKELKNALDDLLPKTLIPVIIEYCGLDAYKKVHEISREERQRLIIALKKFRITVTSLRGFSEAIITSGGVSVKEISPSTMESKILKNLYIAGEMIDTDALTGGYNLQIAWSTGWLAGNSAAESR